LTIVGTTTWIHICLLYPVSQLPNVQFTFFKNLYDVRSIVDHGWGIFRMDDTFL